MQSAQLDNNEVIIEYMTDAQGNKIKKLKPIFIKSEPNREHTCHVDSDDNLPAVPEENFTQKREITVDSYSESISSDNDPSDDRTITADSDSSVAPTFEETPCEWEANPKGIRGYFAPNSCWPPECSRGISHPSLTPVQSSTI